ncbi:MAG: serine hydrolase, partial [Planctomycetes bacterium]|nr:serine hydrolase [Planctomycetota bacterium]
SGKTYEQYLHEKLFEPAGMKTTGYVIPKWNPERMAHGYDSDGRDAGTFESRNWGPNGPGWVLVGNGGILSTPGDMYRWHIALQGEAILSKAAKEKYTTPHVLTRMGDHYGYGWGLLTTPRKTKLVWHNGGNGIFFTDFRRYVDEDVVTYINSNGDVHATELGPNQLTSLVFGERDVTMPPRVVAVDPARVARLAGAYRTESGDEIRVAAAGEQITISGTSTPLFAMLSGLQRPGGTFARQEDLVRRVVESGAKGDFQAVRQAMGSNSPPLETVQRNQGARWKGWREEKGEYKGVEILGSVVRGPLRVFARILFEHGSQTLAYDWMGPDLIGIGPAGSEPTRVLLPQSASEFVRFNPQQSKPLLVRFDVEADGAAAGLTLSSESGDVTARRHD